MSSFANAYCMVRVSHTMNASAIVSKIVMILPSGVLAPSMILFSNFSAIITA